MTDLDEEYSEPTTESQEEKSEEEILQELISDLKTNILIVGCGGGGNNTLTRLAQEGVEGVEMLAANTDAQHLLNTTAENKMLIGRECARGMGAGSDPVMGQAAADESRNEILEACMDADIVFLTAGLGGGTGTGSLPVFAKLAKQQKALTIAVVTMPFTNEGAKRMENARQGLERLRKVVDTVIVIPNDRLLNDEISQLPLNQAFREADDILAGAIKCMSEITTATGLVNIDFADLRSIMSAGGVAMIGTGEGSGANRASEAVKSALSSPLIEVDIEGASGALVNVTGGSDMSLKEAETVLEEIYSKINKEARIIWGASVDPELDNSIRVMLVVTGVKSEQILGPPSSVEEDLETRYGIDFVQ